MTTGYSDPVEKGEVTEFADFAKNCMQAFMFSMRDLPLGSAPRPVEVDDYTVKQVEVNRQRVAALAAMSVSEAGAVAEQERAVARERAATALADVRVKNARLAKMLAQVEAWVPPTERHVRIKEFMVEQLSSSIDDEKFWTERLVDDGPVDVAEWMDDRMADAVRDLERSCGWLEQAKVRVADSNLWLAQMLESLS